MKYTLKELRARKNKTQKQVAKDIGVTVQTYNMWEKNPCNIKISKALILADYFNCDINELAIE